MAQYRDIFWRESINGETAGVWEGTARANTLKKAGRKAPERHRPETDKTRTDPTGAWRQHQHWHEIRIQWVRLWPGSSHHPDNGRQSCLSRFSPAATCSSRHPRPNRAGEASAKPISHLNIAITHHASAPSAICGSDSCGGEEPGLSTRRPRATRGPSLALDHWHA